MDFKSWRTGKGLTLDAAARAIGLTGKNPGRTLQRIETGENRADADLIAAMEAVSEGAVTAADMHTIRLSRLQTEGRSRELPREATA